jgi:hypothetical protein
MIPDLPISMLEPVMDVSTAASLNLFAFRNALQDGSPAQAPQQTASQAASLSSGGSASMLGQIGSADSYTNLLRQVGEAPVAAASYTLGVQSGNGASEVQNLLASAQPSSSLSGLLSSGGLSSLAGLDSRAAAGLVAYQVRSAPNAADAYAQIQALTTQSAQALNGVTMSLMA